MARVVPFTADTRAAVLYEIAASAKIVALRVWPYGAIAELTTEVSLLVGHGRLVAAEAPGTSGLRAMVRVCLASGGRIDVQDADPPERPPSAFPAFAAMYAEAERSANTILQLVQPLGGLDAVPVLEPDPGDGRAASLPAEAQAVLQLVGGQRTVAAIMGNSPYDEVLTATILDRLAAAQVIGAEVRPQSQPPPPAAPVAAPDKATLFATPVRTADGLQRPADGSSPMAPMHWDASQPSAPAQAPMSWPPEAAPPVRAETPADLVETSPGAAVAASPPPGPRDAPPVQLPPEPRVASTPGQPAPRRSPSRGWSTGSRESDAAMRNAALGGAWNRTLLAGAALVLVLLLIVWLLLREDEPETPPPPPIDAGFIVAPPPDAGVVPPEPKPKKKKRRRRSRYSLSNPPPVAGPRDDSRLRMAEQMMRQERFDAAAAILSQLRRELPGNAATWVLSGMLEDARGNLGLAMKYTKRALQVDRNNYRAWVLKGWLEQSQQQAAEAVRSYRRALSIAPGHDMSTELRIVARRLEREGR